MSAAAFSPVNARTHLVSELGAAILASTRAGPLTVQAIFDAVLDADSTVDADFAAQDSVAFTSLDSVQAGIDDPAFLVVRAAIDGLIQAGLLRQVAA